MNAMSLKKNYKVNETCIQMYTFLPSPTLQLFRMHFKFFFSDNREPILCNTGSSIGMNYGVSLKRIFCRLSVTSCSKLFSFTGGQVTFGEWYETYGLS